MSLLDIDGYNDEIKNHHVIFPVADQIGVGINGSNDFLSISPPIRNNLKESYNPYTPQIPSSLTTSSATRNFQTSSFNKRGWGSVESRRSHSCLESLVEQDNNQQNIMSITRSPGNDFGVIWGYFVDTPEI